MIHQQSKCLNRHLPPIPFIVTTEVLTLKGPLLYWPYTVDSGWPARLIAASPTLQIRVVTHTELQFPAFVFGFMDAAEFKHAEFGDAGMERDRHVIVVRRVAVVDV